jgi:NADH dehydrogenase/NADH:ubiquinone oxidoreductase subunit G
MSKENFIKCDYCDKNSKCNLQKIWVKYDINEKGNYSEDKNFDTFNIEEPMNENNLHLCRSCFENWLNGKI